MVVHVYHPYRQPDGVNYCAAVNGHCSHLCLPAPRINDKSPKISCACPNGLTLMSDGLMCAEEGNRARGVVVIIFTYFTYVLAALAGGEGRLSADFESIFVSPVGFPPLQTPPQIKIIFHPVLLFLFSGWT